MSLRMNATDLSRMGHAAIHCLPKTNEIDEQEHLTFMEAGNRLRVSLGLPFDILI